MPYDKTYVQGLLIYIAYRIKHDSYQIRATRFYCIHNFILLYMAGVSAHPDPNRYSTHREENQAMQEGATSRPIGGQNAYASAYKRPTGIPPIRHPNTHSDIDTQQQQLLL
jgi:hypothetical protein